MKVKRAKLFDVEIKLVKEGKTFFSNLAAEVE